ncbi:MAG TPA: DUF4058 family protein [Gemmatales bacterium]|nr:DUF4058 family protein [Gemmatales bacterium]HMP60823.1 DUF4058 family protein [Gemmatales bacterium]
MPSPLPGMDPYLEARDRWPAFQHQMVLGLAEALQPALTDRYRLRFATRAYTTDLVLFTSIAQEQHKEHYLEIRQRSTDQLVVWLDLVSPTNRTTAEGRRRYQDSIHVARSQQSHIVEMDLVLEGETCLDADRTSLPPHDYCVSVWRAGRASAYELYGCKLANRLPRIRVPLAGDDRDIVLDLQTVMNRVYDRHWSGRIDYTQEPTAPVPADIRAWLNEFLTDQGLRGPKT